MKIKIGELAKRSGCQVVTIRYYEKEGLIHAPERSEGNYRLYDSDDVERLHFIRHCRMLDISLAEIKALLAFEEHPTVKCDWINQLVAQRPTWTDRSPRSSTCASILWSFRPSAPEAGNTTAGSSRGCTIRRRAPIVANWAAPDQELTTKSFRVGRTLLPSFPT